MIQEMSDRSKRLRIYEIQQDRLRDLFNCLLGEVQPGGLRIHVPMVPISIPQGAVVRGFQMSFETRAIQFLVEHESFDPVANFVHPPRFPGDMIFHSVLVPMEKVMGAVELPAMMAPVKKPWEFLGQP